MGDSYPSSEDDPHAGVVFWGLTLLFLLCCWCCCCGFRRFGIAGKTIALCAEDKEKEVTFEANEVSDRSDERWIHILMY